MKSKLNKQNLLSSFVFGITLIISFAIGEIYYNSVDGTDFYRYFDYLEYFRGGLDSPGREQGILYYWFVSLFVKLSRQFYLVSDWETIYSSAIQLSNFLIYLIGLGGMYKLFKSYSYEHNDILYTLSILNFFPPLYGARLIMKPEIIGFAFLPWVIVMIDKYFDSKEIKYLFFSVPLLALLLTSKGTVTGITVFILLYLYIQKLKETNIKDLVFAAIALVGCFSILFIENTVINGYNIFTHPQSDQYLNRATFSFVINLNVSDLFNNPFRNQHANSFIGITLIDTFGDYFERYWDHERSLLSRNRLDLFNNSLLRRWVSIITSLLFFILTFYKNNKNMPKFNYLYLIGAFTLLLSAFGLFGLNFNPGKGDTVKTHYYSFVLGITFAVLIINHISKRKLLTKLLSIFTTLLIFLFILGFPKTYTGEYNEGASYAEVLNSKLESSISCNIVNQFVDLKTDIDSKCLTASRALCGYSEVFNKPIESEEGYLIFISDEFFIPINLTNENGNVVTVSGYAECLHYQDGGYLHSQSAAWGKTTQPINQLIGIISIISILVFTSHRKIYSHE